MQTLYRASPLEVPCRCGNCLVEEVGSQALLLSFLAVSLVLLPLFALGLLWFLRPIIDLFGTFVLTLCGVALVVGLALWSTLLQSVGRKYNITDAWKAGPGFFLKVALCPCAMNVRVGLHVDRAQGFYEPKRSVLETIELGGQLRRATTTQSQGFQGPCRRSWGPDSAHVCTCGTLYCAEDLTHCPTCGTMNQQAAARTDATGLDASHAAAAAAAVIEGLAHTEAHARRSKARRSTVRSSAGAIPLMTV
eukprot:TRINITY_DN20810_c0_g1_i4.p1 TRINITY_DN20810_c0_g1~~TRINITY_DN20810_c0_g1_i4.p1  ORF type:complete len:249 (-),score=25.33 TRINITY_DN20810_c0_g1_i4:24-770(-)